MYDRKEHEEWLGMTPEQEAELEKKEAQRKKNSMTILGAALGLFCVFVLPYLMPTILELMAKIYGIEQ